MVKAQRQTRNFRSAASRSERNTRVGELKNRIWRALVYSLLGHEYYVATRADGYQSCERMRRYVATGIGTPV